MSSKNFIGNEASGVQESERAVDEDGGAVVDEVAEREGNLAPTVEMEVQGKVDTNHPDAGARGLTLAEEERIEAREQEIERTRVRWDRRQDSDREVRCRDEVGRRSRGSRSVFAKRAASVDRWLDPDLEDPREELSRAELAAVNQETARMAEELDGWSRAAISRRLAERVVDGGDVTSAVIRVFEDLRAAAGQVVPIGRLEDNDRKEVTIQGRVETLWDPSHPSIAQVGLIADESGTTRVTIWEKSDAPWIEEGEKVRIHGAARNWYEGRVSLAVTGWSTIHFPERGQWWHA